MTQKELKIVRETILAYIAKHPAATAGEIVNSKEIAAILPYHDIVQKMHVVSYQLKKIAAGTVGPTTPTTYSSPNSTKTTLVFTGGDTTWVDAWDYYAPKPSVVKPSVVGAIGDTHHPYCHPEYLNFCEHTFNRYKVDRVVHIGDEVDNYALSYHEKDPNAPLSAVTEAEKAQAEMNKWYKVFPVVDVLVGNHSALPHRQATTIGLQKKFLKTYEQIWEAPKGWKWHMSLEIDGVLYEHGLQCTGPSGALDKAIRARQSVVIGHSHTFGGVLYHSSNKDMIFGMNVGCGVDQRQHAFDYSKNNKDKWTLGCGVINEGREAIFVPMITDSNGRWVK